MTYSNVNEWTPDEWQQAVDDNQEESEQLEEWDDDHGVEREDNSDD